MEGPVDRWREARDEVCEEILTRGFNAERNTFTQHYDTDEVDASLLVLPLIGFIKGDDPKMLGTIEAIEKDLMRDGLLMRYRTETDVDGLPGGEHPFLACSFWLVSAYAAAGRLDDANALFDRLVGLVNDVGLLSEEYDPRNKRMVGNFPQAFSHLTLVQAAFRLRVRDRHRALTAPAGRGGPQRPSRDPHRHARPVRSRDGPGAGDSAPSLNHQPARAAQPRTTHRLMNLKARLKLCCRGT